MKHDPAFTTIEKPKVTDLSLGTEISANRPIFCLTFIMMSLFNIIFHILYMYFTLVLLYAVYAALVI